jgi:hypothetical protein
MYSNSRISMEMPMPARITCGNAMNIIIFIMNLWFLNEPINNNWLIFEIDGIVFK